MWQKTSQQVNIEISGCYFRSENYKRENTTDDNRRNILRSVRHILEHEYPSIIQEYCFHFFIRSNVVFFQQTCIHSNQHRRRIINNSDLVTCCVNKVFVVSDRFSRGPLIHTAGRVQLSHIRDDKSRRLDFSSGTREQQ